jgi:hypothetical protein
MRRVSICFLVILVPCFAVPQSPGQTAAKVDDRDVQKNRLLTLYRAYQAAEVSKGKPVDRIDDLGLEAAVVKELKERFNFEQLGVSLTQAEKDDLPKMIMVYEKIATKEGGLVLLYDGSVKTLTAKEVKKVLKIQD